MLNLMWNRNLLTSFFDRHFYASMYKTVHGVNTNKLCVHHGHGYDVHDRHDIPAIFQD